MGCYLLLLFFLACSGCFPVHPCRYLPAVCCASASQPGAHCPAVLGLEGWAMSKHQLRRHSHKPCCSEVTVPPESPPYTKTLRLFPSETGETALPARGEHAAVLGWHEGFWHWDLPEGSSSQGKRGTSALSRHAAIHEKHRSGRCEGRGLQRCFATISPAQYKTHSRGHCILQIIWEKIITI